MHRKYNNYFTKKKKKEKKIEGITTYTSPALWVCSTEIIVLLDGVHVLLVEQDLLLNLEILDKMFACSSVVFIS